MTPNSISRSPKRQRHVLDQLVANHLLTAVQANAAYRAPLRLRHDPAGH